MTKTELENKQVDLLIDLGIASQVLYSAKKDIKSINKELLEVEKLILACSKEENSELN